MTKIYTFLYTLLLLAFSSIVNGQIKSGSVNIGSGATQMDMTITMNTNTSTVSFSITGPASRWFAFGFGASSMSTSAYTILANASAQIAKEYNQAYHAAPVLQTTQNLANMSSSTSGGAKTYTFTRPMNTNDANDYLFTTATSSISLIWAYGYTTTLAQHASRGVTTIVLSSICNIPITNLPLELICQGDSALIFGNYETNAGIYWDTLQSVNGCDSVLMQSLSVGQDFALQLPDTNLCFGDSIQLFGSWINQAGLFYDSLTSIHGCDSVNSIQVHMIQIDTQVYISNNQLNAAYAYADHYQWYDCQNNQVISGANNMSFQPLQNGSYKVEITSLGCMATSSCHAVSWLGIANPTNNDIHIWPNPVRNQLFVDLDNKLGLCFIEIYSIDGRKVGHFNLESDQNSIELSYLKSGFYIYQLKNEGGTLITGRFTKE